MANYGPRLKWASTRSSDDPKLTLTEQDWLGIEAAYATELSSENRQRLIVVCNDYFFNVRPELSAATESEVERHAAKLKKSLEPFFQWAYGALPPEQGNAPSDGYVEFEHRLATLLASNSIAISPDSLAGQHPIPESVKDWLDDNRLSLVLDNRIITEVAIRICSGLSVIESGRSTNPETEVLTGFVPGNAWKAFLVATRELALSLKLPTALYLNGGTEAAAFPKMLFFLNSKFPDEFKNDVNSPNALAMQIKRLKSK